MNIYRNNILTTVVLNAAVLINDRLWRQRRISNHAPRYRKNNVDLECYDHLFRKHWRL
jgi:hypothetical protein